MTGYEPGGREFESLRARQIAQGPICRAPFSIERPVPAKSLLYAVGCICLLVRQSGDEPDAWRISGDWKTQHLETRQSSVRVERLVTAISRRSNEKYCPIPSVRLRPQAGGQVEFNLSPRPNLVPINAAFQIAEPYTWY